MRCAAQFAKKRRERGAIRFVIATRLTTKLSPSHVMSDYGWPVPVDVGGPTEYLIRFGQKRQCLSSLLYSPKSCIDVTAKLPRCNALAGLRDTIDPKSLIILLALRGKE